MLLYGGMTCDKKIGQLNFKQFVPLTSKTTPFTSILIISKFISVRI